MKKKTSVLLVMIKDHS